jgi:L-alanine-DL-glutamate epimerase-like enolase superfamily enzyme
MRAVDVAVGEAQIAVIDLLGMFAGISLAKLIAGSKAKIASSFLLLTLVDLACIFREIKRSVN